MTVDEDADYVLVARGVQQDLRRLLLRRLPVGFDLHDDVADELTALAAADRMLISDESGAGAPQQYVSLATLKSYLLDLFDLHDDVPDEMTAAADADRMLISDESADGDPQKWISIQTLSNSLGALHSEKLPDEFVLNTMAEVTVTHNLGRVPLGFEPFLVNKIAQGLFSPGDELYLPRGDASTSSQDWYGLFVYELTTTDFKVRIHTDSNGLIPTRVPTGSGSSVTDLQLANWRWRLTIWG